MTEKKILKNIRKKIPQYIKRIIHNGPLGFKPLIEVQYLQIKQCDIPC